MSLLMRTALVVLSGVSFWPLVYLEEPLHIEPLGAVGYVLTGSIFGFLVLVPFIGMKTWWYGRVVGLVLGSILIYALVVELAVDGYGPLDLGDAAAIIVSGIVGALLVGALTWVVAPLRPSVRLWPYLSVAGVLGGFVFDQLFTSDYEFVMSVGYVAWQVPVFLALYWGSGAAGSVSEPQP